jgi:hypothetical protein
MPVDREPISISQFAELVGVEPARLVDVEFSRRNSTVMLVLEPVDVQQKDVSIQGRGQEGAAPVSASSAAK